MFLHEGVSEVAGKGHEGTLGGGIGKESRFPAMGVHAAYVDYASGRLAEFRKSGLDQGQGATVLTSRTLLK